MGEGPVIFVLIWKCTCLLVFLRAWTDQQEPIGDGTLSVEQDARKLNSWPRPRFLDNDHRFCSRTLSLLNTFDRFTQLCNTHFSKADFGSYCL